MVSSTLHFTVSKAKSAYKSASFLRNRGNFNPMTQTPRKGLPATFIGRTLGRVVLVGLQLLIGVIHLFAGLFLVAYEDFSALPAVAAYDFYTLVFGLLVIAFDFGLWYGKKWGWIGTITVSVFVIIADSTAVLGMPVITGTPAGPAALEITYSVILIGYLLLGKVRRQFS